MIGFKYFITANLLLTGIMMFSCNKKSTEPKPEPQITNFVEHPIDLNFAGIHCIKVIDLDGDGDKDIVGGSEITPYSQSRGISWWRNEGGSPITWTRFTVDSNFDHVMSVDVGNIDGDSYPDIIATSWNLNQIGWWKNSGNPTSGWTSGVIKSDFVNAHDAQCSDINDDGNTDVAGVSSSGEVIVCYNDGSNPPSWDVQILNSLFNGGKTILVRDIDQDGDFDLMGTSSDANRITWWKNQGGESINWISHPVDHNFIGGSDIDIIDMNNDGFYDVIGTSWKSDELSYWICQNLEGDQWQKTMITNQLEVAVSSYGCDFDMDGDLDIVAVGKVPGELVIYINDNFSWTKTTLKSNFNGGSALAIDDIDEDGYYDILAGASGSGRLYWWENVFNSEE